MKNLEIEGFKPAPPASPLRHLAINISTEKGIVNWLEPVSDEEYYGHTC